MKRNFILYFIIFLEGYVVLSAELMAIRQIIPFVGSGTDTLSIIIAAVLMPLAVGYYAGGRYRGRVRQKLIRNFLIAGIFLTFGLSYVVLQALFTGFTEGLEWKNRLVLTTLYALLFIVTPVYLLGQTVPLISNYFRRAHLPRTTGKILFCSTVGSFLGAVFTTIVLMNTIGVSGTAMVTIACISVLVLLLSKQLVSLNVLVAAGLFLSAFALNSPTALRSVSVVNDNAYNTAQIEKYGDALYLRLNRSYSSGIYPDDPEAHAYEYVRYIEDRYIRHFRRTNMKGRILVLGAGGFTIGLNDTRNDYTFVDIDHDLKHLAETHFLKRKLGDNKHFIAEEARGYLARVEDMFDLIIVDVFRGLDTGAPEHLATKEFFTQVKNRLTPRGVMIVNHFGSALAEDAYSRGLDNTIRSVFPHANRVPVYDFNPWQSTTSADNNVLYIARNRKGERGNIYRDNLNKSMFDKKMNVPY